MKTIVLIGMMGCGKTTSGKLLGEKLNIPVMDIDEQIEKSSHKTVAEIFAQDGEMFFRELEKNTIKHLFKRENLILSLGGGAFENNETRELLLNNSIVVYLKTSAQNIFARLKNNTDRPLLKNNMTVGKIQEIIDIRNKNYELAHFTISTDNKNPNQITDEILGVI